MPKRIIAPVLFAVLLWAALAQGAESDALVGFWITQERDAQFEIYKCGHEYCAKISSMAEPTYSPSNKQGLAGLPKMDRKNPDPSLRRRPLLGLTIFEGLSYEGGNSWRGKVYNPEDGKTYKCKVSLADKGARLKVRGYLGVTLFGRTQTWTRLPAGSGHAASSAP